jgi:hypothetical protein
LNACTLPRSSLLQRFLRRGEFNLLESFGDQDRDTLALQCAAIRIHSHLLKKTIALGAARSGTPAVHASNAHAR